MKKIIVSLALACSVFYFGQEKDLKAINQQVQSLSQTATNAYEAKDYITSATKFNELYNLLKENGNENKTYLYYSGLSYALANKSDEAIKIYSSLINSGYTGVETRYTAKEKKSGKISDFDKKTWDFIKKSADDYTDFKEEKTPSVEPSLYEGLSSLYLMNKQYPEASALIEKGLQKFPTSAKLKENQGIALMNSGGDNDKVITNLKEQLTANPSDATNWYNLGVLLSRKGRSEEAIDAFQKAINLKPQMDDAYNNLVLTIVGDDKKVVEEINALRKASKMDEATDKIEARKERFEKAIPFAEKWHQVSPKNFTAVSYLKEFYQVTKNRAKAEEFIKKEAELAK